jgi:hypothetical protein
MRKNPIIIKDISVAAVIKYKSLLNGEDNTIPSL